MTQPIDNCINKIVEVLLTVSPFTNSKQVPVNPPSMMSYSTFAITHPISGSIDIGPTATRKTIFNIAIDVLSKDIDLARTLQALKPLLDTIPNALIREVSYDSDGNPGDMFSNSVSTFNRVSFSEIPLTDYGGVPVIGYRFTMEDVKILVNL